MEKEIQERFSGIVFVRRKMVGQSILSPEREVKMTENETSTNNKLALFDEKFILNVRINVGDVYLARFPNSVGSELEGEHFVVAVMNSRTDNPNVVIVPLTSLKEKNRNPAHSVYLGYIKGINNGKQSVALLNQVASIDKKRLLSDKDIDKALALFEGKNCNDNDVVCSLMKTHYRLTSSQLERLLVDAHHYFLRNSRKRWKKKLVDF